MLNTEQERAVKHPGGPLMIIAGAGTGKTTVITHRIAHLIAEKFAKPEEILALTFTDKAAANMEEGVDVLVPYGSTGMWINTFHAFGDKILREEALELGLPSDVVPTALELSKLEEEDKQQQQQAAQMKAKEEQARMEASLAATKIQIEGQMRMNELAQTIKQQKNLSDAQLKQIDQQLEATKIQAKAASDIARGKSYENAAAIKASSDKDMQMTEMLYKSQASPDGKGV